MKFAIVGFDCLLPGSATGEDWITRSRVHCPSLSEVPARRWPFAVNGCRSKLASHRGGFITDDRSPADWLSQVCQNALPHQVPPNTGLIVATLTLPSTDAVRSSATAYGRLAPGSFSFCDWARGEAPADRHFGGRTTQTVAHSLGLNGPCSSIDAACASGLYAVHLACEQLRTGSADLMIAAGLQAADSAFLFMGFTQLGALSKTGCSAPLSTLGDGLLIGEGAAAVAIKRLGDAISANDTIHAVICGSAIGNDGKSGNLLAPQSAGQVRVMQRCHRAGGITADSIEYIECHATGTPRGDAAEINSLIEVFGASRTRVISSNKGLIGHTITVAGVAGLIRAIGAVRDGLFPATPHSKSPLPMGPLQLLPEPTEWRSKLRRAGVNAFGFGGTNAHVVIESWHHQTAADDSPSSPSLSAEIVGLSAQLGPHSRDLLIQRLRSEQTLFSRQPAPNRLYPSPIASAFLPPLLVDAADLHTPPDALKKLLPQQAIALILAKEAVADAPPIDPQSTAVVIGMNLDMRIADYTLDHCLTTPGTLAPPLTSEAVQGLLPNFIANRISAHLGLEGPSYVISSGKTSGFHALKHAMLLLTDPEISAVIVGAIDAHGHPTSLAVNPSGEPISEGGAVFILRRPHSKSQSYGTLRSRTRRPLLPTPLHLGDSGAASGGLLLFNHLVLRQSGAIGLTGFCDRVECVELEVNPSVPCIRPLTLPPAKLPVSIPPALPVFSPDWSGWCSDAIPHPPVRLDTPYLFDPVEPIAVQLPAHLWPMSPQPPIHTTPAPAPAGTALLHLTDLITHQARHIEHARHAHALFLAEHATAIDGLAQWSRWLELLRQGQAIDAPEQRPAAPHSRPNAVAPRTEAPPPASPPPVGPARTFDKAALQRFASGPLSGCLGPHYADLDHLRPRVRLPLHPLLLVSRVLDITGNRGDLGPCQITTEYDLPVDADWIEDERPPASVIIESGQADLFLVSYLGIDALCKGERLYRLLDCDLTFHGLRPKVGLTLRHHIRINQFAQVGGKILFYFEYDCTMATTGVPILTMRNGVAGFFTPKELSVPQGVDTAPALAEPCHFVASHTPPSSLSDAQVTALKSAHFIEAFGPQFIDHDGCSLHLPSSQWGLIHRVHALTVTGGPHGLGEVWAEQDLNPTDWFNDCHFLDDPCMPGTLMFDGCLQALQIWMLGAGLGQGFGQARFEPIDGSTTELRCRGQVSPGHSSLRYQVLVKQAKRSKQPYAIADVILHVDGTPVVRANNIGLRIVGERLRSFEAAHFVEFSVGSHEAAFGPSVAHFDRVRRGPRIPGPPFLFLHRALQIQAQAGTLGANTSALLQYDVPEDAWYFVASPRTTMPFVIFIEIALQPCGWLTAFEGAAAQSDRDLYFRNLGGTGTLFMPVHSKIGTLTTRTSLSSVSESAGMILTFFDIEVWCSEGLVFSGQSTFGYFTREALAAQKGLDYTPDSFTPEPKHTINVVREDLQMFDRVLLAAPTGGSKNLGRYIADLDIKPDAWFFKAHFHEDPVMPGSLGLEGLTQLARWVLIQSGVPDDAVITPLQLNQPVKWTYRGQVLRSVRTVRLDLHIHARGKQHLVATGWLLADDVPIYCFENFGVSWTRPVPQLSPAVTHRPRVGTLLHTFTVTDNTGHGTLVLDPASQPWLADHRPTLSVPALPMAFAAEIAAEAGALMRPGLHLVQVSSLKAHRWIHTQGGPLTLHINATSKGDSVHVTLDVFEENHRFPALSGLKTAMEATVHFSTSWSHAPPECPPLINAQPASLSASRYYHDGHTFHGPSLWAMRDLGERGTNGATALLEANFGEAFSGLQPPILDPILLDAATHPMMSSTPELWHPSLRPGQLAYPVSADQMCFYGPRPTGPVRCDLRLVRSEPAQLIFDVWLSHQETTWCTFRWTEAVLPGGLFGGPPAQIQRFLREKASHPTRIGQPHHLAWRVGPSDLIEPLKGSLASIFCSRHEQKALLVLNSGLERTLACKELIREHIRQALKRDIHPSRINIGFLSPSRAYVEAVPDLSAQEFMDLFQPIASFIRLEEHPHHIEATLCDETHTP